MKMNGTEWPIVSVVIATYNSSAVLERTLSALRNQSYPQKCLEVIVVDGGSSDLTLRIAEQYGCIVLDNPQTDPVNAKMIGYNYAHGRYLVTLDHDEVLVNPNSISNKVYTLMNNPQCKVAFCSGYKRPDDYPGLNQYISEYGDPFSMFVYRFSKDCQYFAEDMEKRASVVKKNELYTEFEFGKKCTNVILELCCVATMIDMQYFLGISDFLKKPDQMVHLFYMMLDHGEKKVIVMQNDPLFHYSADSIKAYFPKLRWRVINNVHYAERADQGFKGRTEYLNGNKRQYMFPLYAFSIILPCIDGMILSIRHQNISYLWHPVLSLYVVFYIVYQYVRKMLGLRPILKTYDGKNIAGAK